MGPRSSRLPLRGLQDDSPQEMLLFPATGGGVQRSPGESCELCELCELCEDVESIHVHVYIV